jgi:hypothetical protein
MSAHRPHHISRRAAERLLSGEPAGARGAGPDAVADLLAAAAGPGREPELAGEPAALAAFRSAQLAPVPRHRRRPVIRSVLATSLTAKIAAVAVVAVSFGGVATAALAGHHAPRPGPGPTVAPAASGTATPAGDRDTTGPTAAAGTGRGNTGEPSPTPDLVGLCHGYPAGAGGAAHSPAFDYLIDTAGGPAKVPQFCADLLRDRHDGSDDSAGRSRDPQRPHSGQDNDNGTSGGTDNGTSGGTGGGADNGAGGGAGNAHH